MAGWGGGIGNKAQLRPAKLELGLGLSLAILLMWTNVTRTNVTWTNVTVNLF